MIKAVIFDMDGVLVDSEPKNLEQLRGFYKSYGTEVDDAFMHSLVGSSYTYTYTESMRVMHMDWPMEKFKEKLDDYCKLHAFGYDEVLNPGVKETLIWLREHGYKTAVASSSAMHQIQTMENVCDLVGCFDELLSGEMFHESKPNGYLKLYRNGKLYYEGYWENGTFNGEGTLYKEDGSVKTGDWVAGRLSQTLVDVQLPQGHYYGYAKDGKPDGLGKIDYADGVFYQGKWEAGLWEGEGLYINANDSVYGIWEKGKICGDVIYRTPQLYFEGTFIDNVPVGAGNLAQSDGSYYSGFWLDGKREGNGDIIFSNGDSYSGEWTNNEFNGFGVYEYAAAKAVYQGEWADGLQNGNGFYKCPQFSYNGQLE